MNQLIRVLTKKSAFLVYMSHESRNLPTLTALFSKCETSSLPPFSSARRLCSKPDTDRNDEKNPYYVYVGSLTSQLRRVKVLSLTTSALGICAQPVLMNSSSSLPLLVAGSSILFFFTFVTPILLHFVAKRYVIDIVYDDVQDVYTAHVMTFFGTSKPVSIKPGEAQLPVLAGMFTSMEVRGIPMFVDVNSCDLEHYKRILGFDKPIDLKSENIASHSTEAQERK